MRAVVAGGRRPALGVGVPERAVVHFTVEPIGALDELEREWRRLERHVSPSFFVSWNWIGTLLEMIPPRDRPLLLRGVSAGRTVALAVLGDAVVRRRGVIRAHRWVVNATGDPAFDCIHLEHNALLADPRIGWDGLLEAFAAAKDVDELGLPGVAAAPAAHQVEDRGLLRMEAREPSFAVDLSTLSHSRGDVAAILSRNARSQLRRARRRLDPVWVEAATSEAEALDFFRIMKGFHVSWWQRRGVAHAFTHEFFERFHERLIERAFADGSIQLLRVRSGDRTIGVLYNFVLAQHVYAYQSGFVQPAAGERPGVVAHALAVERAWQQGARVYDFMAGENRLKVSFANCTDTLSWTVVQKPRLRFRAEHRALGVAWRPRTDGRFGS
ncbi:GNAT family N-acetyltransferase [Mycobacterium hodleri]|uniref:GNAT family N-acetyltransferase n=1 Tax=Mycolicibacterium hodleri TaxID=49897 RepID=UPI0021F3577B|nr:GNAT family N-acetyltransferase [Mycolicibacterium hodleri]MCV7135829.1 GNAT family N-acetyltransferase [Mycolicibacterium hodleri]